MDLCLCLLMQSIAVSISSFATLAIMFDMTLDLNLKLEGQLDS